MPPTIFLIIYGLITEQSIGALFLAGIFPGLGIAVLWILTIFIWAKITPGLAPAGGRSTWKERFASLPEVAVVLGVFLLMIVGLLKGFFTPTEAGGIGVAAVHWAKSLMNDEEQVEDRFGNQTRFVLIGHEAVARSAANKTSLALFMKEDRPGTLLMILAEFAYAGVNLTKIQSRPTKRALGDYMFLIDIEGHADDSLIKTALDSLRLKLREVKLLGSYAVQGSSDGGKR